MLIAHKIALDPNNAQATYLARAAMALRAMAAHKAKAPALRREP